MKNMKKFLSLMMCAGLMFTLVGCGEKKDEDSKKDEGSKSSEKAEAKNQILKCSIKDTSDSEDLSSELSYVVEFDKDGKTAQDASMKLKFSFSEEMSDLFDDDYAETFCDDYKGDTIKKCTSSKNGNTITADISFDVDKILEEEDEDDEEDVSLKGTIDEVKAALEKQLDTTCTISK